MADKLVERAVELYKAESERWLTEMISQSEADSVGVIARLCELMSYEFHTSDDELKDFLYYLDPVVVNSTIESLQYDEYGNRLYSISHVYDKSVEQWMLKKKGNSELRICMRENMSISLYGSVWGASAFGYSQLKDWIGIWLTDSRFD